MQTTRLSVSALALAMLMVCALPSCSGPQDAPEDPDEMKMLVLGMDGMDPVLLRKLMDEGRMPNFERIAEQGAFKSLGTSMPPQSPVAWSNFISGARPNTHMIWDFIHRKPVPNEGSSLPVTPYLSTSESKALPIPWYQAPFPEKLPWFGGNQIPLSGGEETVSKRLGPEFWRPLVERGVDTTIYRLPATFPPAKVEGRGEFRCLCGMGTPDMLGTYGEFTNFRSDIAGDKSPSGGHVYRVKMENNRGTSQLVGPPNAFQKPDAKGKVDKLEAPVEFIVDPELKSVLITVSGNKAVVREGEWSDWVRVSFDGGVPMLGAADDAGAAVRFHVRRAFPTLDVYCTPLNIDPTNPFQAISEPSEWAAEIAEESGALYYTTGIPEDTKALRSNPQALTEDEFLSMVHNLARERHVQYKRALANFKRGFLFFYFGHTDQLAHIFWRDTDPEHPGRLPEQEGKYSTVIEDAYLEMDERLAEALEVLDDNDILIIMSDHGFSSFRRGFNVNTWLQQNGYQEWKGYKKSNRAHGLFNIKFAKTQSYAVGLNCLYINLKGREKGGIVPPAQKKALMHEIGDKLLEVRDDDGSQVIAKMYYVEEEFPDLTAEQMMTAPDMLIGYAANYRGSWATALGGMASKVLENNKDRWSGDHCIAAHIVPGILVTNQQVNVDDPTLSDLAPSILNLFGAEKPDGMTGRAILGQPRAAQAPKRGDEG